MWLLEWPWKQQRHPALEGCTSYEPFAPLYAPLPPAAAAGAAVYALVRAAHSRMSLLKSHGRIGMKA